MTLATSPVLLSADAEKALRLPIGAASPLWMMIGTAAMMGAVAFWSTRWMRPAMPVLEMPRLKAPPEMTAAEPLATEAVPVSEPQPLDAATVVPDPLSESPAPVVELDQIPVAASAEIGVAEQAAVEQALAGVDLMDDLAVLNGIGPKLAQRLADRGIVRFAQIAALTPEEVAALDSEMKLLGRIERDSWVAQAKTLAGQ
jgi:predicted flap endonuclease-1-like 5' DNA nuclease